MFNKDISNRRIRNADKCHHCPELFSFMVPRNELFSPILSINL